MYDLYYTITMPFFGTDSQRIEDLVEDSSKVGERVLLFVVGPTLATNLLSTGLIAWKAWCAPLVASDPRQLFLTMSPA